MEITNSRPVIVNGLAELAQDMPDNSWYEIKILFRKEDDGARIVISREITRRSDVYEQDGELWFRDETDELQLIAGVPNVDIIGRKP